MNCPRHNRVRYAICQRATLISLTVCLVAWETIPHLDGQTALFLAPPSAVLQALWKLAVEGKLAHHIATSLFRAIAGLILAVAVGVPLGFLLGGWFPRFERVVNPLLRFLGEVNPFSLFPVFMVLFGIGEVSKFAMIFWVSCWPILFNTITGVRGVDAAHIKTARSMNASRGTILARVVFPGALPSIFTGLKIGASTSFFMLIAAEMIGASSGLGWLVWNAQITYQIPRLFAATVVISVLGLGLTALFGRLEKKALVWREHA